MALEWGDLPVFLAVERGGSIRAASQALKCSHSTVSRRLAAMERALGTQLFQRTPDGLILTAAGAGILAKAQQIEADMADLELGVSGGDVRLQGLVRLTAIPPLVQHLLLPEIARFRDINPDIEIELIPTYTMADLTRRDADIAIRFSKSPDDHLLGRRLPAFRDAIYATRDYVAAHWRNAERTTARWISWSDPEGFARRAAKSPYAGCPVGWSMPSLDLQAEAARQGMGMTFLPCFVGDQDPQLVRVPQSGRYAGRPAWLLTHPGLRKLERVRVFARFLHDALGKRRKLIEGDEPR